MKKLLKIFMYMILVVIALMIVLAVIAKLSEDKITDIAVKKVSEAITAPMEIDDVSFTLIRRFPFATIEFNRIWLASPPALDPADSGIAAIDTLAKIGHLYVSVRTLPLIKKKFEVIKVEIREADFNYMVDSSGTSNFDFLMDTTPDTDTETDTVTTPLNIMLQDLVLKDIVCNYSDQSVGVNARLRIPQIKIKGEAINNVYDGAAKGSLILTDCSLEGTNLYKMNVAEVEFDLGYAHDSVSIDELYLVSDGMELNISGGLFLKEEITADITISGGKLDIGTLIKYAPEQMLKDFGVKKVSGNLSLNAKVKGIVSDSVLLPHVAMDIGMINGRLSTSEYPALKNISFNGHITNGILNNNETTSLDFKSFHFETDQSKFDMEFSVQDIDQPKYNVSTIAEIDLSEFKDFIPDSTAQNVRGRINASLSTQGQLPETIDSLFIDYLMETSRADIDIRNVSADLDSALSVKSFSGQFSYRPNRLSVSNLYASVPLYMVNLINSSFDVSLSGKLSNPDKMGVDLNLIDIETNLAVLNGLIKIKNLDNPEYDMNTYIKMNLGQVKKLLPDTLIKKLSGVITAKIASAGKLQMDSISAQVNDLLFENSSVRLRFYNVLAQMPDTLMSVDKLSGQIYMKPDTIAIDDVNGVFGDIEFKIDSTKIINLYNSVVKNQAEQVSILTKIDLGDLDYDMFLPFMVSDSTTEVSETETISERKDRIKNDANPVEIQPESSTAAESDPPKYTYNLKGKFSVNSLKYNKVYLDGISAKFNISDSLYIVDQFQFNGFDGIYNTSVKYTIMKNNEQSLNVRNSINGLNVYKLLQDFDNFQDYYEPAITHENISGILSTNVNAQVLFRNDSLILDKFYVRADTVKLEKGVITKYPPVQDVAQYLPGIDNLDILEFKTLNSQVFILQNAIYVQKTNIVSNKLDATALGMQSFGEDYSYHLIVYLSDILSGKSNRITKKQDKMGEEASDESRKKGFPVRSYSLDGKSKSGLDTKDARTYMTSTVNAADRTLKLKFNPRLVKYDTGVK